MAQPPVSVPQYPDVPVAPGVPPVQRNPFEPVFKVLLLVADVITVARFFEPSQWGIFTAGGVPVVVADSVLAMDYRREWRLSDYPVEQGGFQTYDKVAVPIDLRVRLSCDGNAMPRGAFLAALDAAAQTLDTYLVATPDVVYPNVNIIHTDYRRARESSAGMIVVDVWLEEVRATVTTQFTNTNTKAPESVADVNSGPVQPLEPTPAQTASLPTPPRPPVGAPLPTPPIPPNLLQVGPDNAAGIAGLT
jgi:hypothetical protein